MREVHVVRHRLRGDHRVAMILGPVHNLPLGTRSVEHRKNDATRCFWVEMVCTTENVEVDTVRLRVRVH